MVVASTFSRDPQDCLEYATVKYLEMTQRREGDAAVKACEESTLDPDKGQPTDVEVLETDVAGNSATTVIAYQGGDLDDQKLRIRVIERDGRWKYYEWLGFADFDAERLIVQIGRKGMLQANSAREAEAIACVIGLMEEMDPGALEKEVYASPQPLSGLWDSCNRGLGAT